MFPNNVEISATLTASVEDATGLKAIIIHGTIQLTEACPYWISVEEAVDMLVHHSLQKGFRRERTTIKISDDRKTITYSIVDAQQPEDS